MRHMPYKMIMTSHPIFFLILFLTLTGCSTTQKEFIPPVFPPPPEEPRFVFEGTIRSSADIKEASTADKLFMFAAGGTNESFGLAKPYGVTVREGRIYVSDTMQRSVLLFDLPHRDFKHIGLEGPGKLLKPLGLDTASNGDLYVADNTAKRIVVFDKQGEFLRTFGGQDILSRPSGIAVSPDGERVYVVDTGGIDTDNHYVVVFDSHSGEHLYTIGKRGTKEGEFNLPLQATTAPDGTVYVVDGGNFRIQAFNPDNSFKKMWGKAGRLRGDFSRPKGIATDSDGNVYVVDAAFGNFQIFNPEGQLLLFVGDRSTAGGPTKYMLPAGIDVDEDGRVYVIDQFFRKLEIYRPAHLTAEDGFLGSRYREQIQKESKEKK